MRWIKDVYTRLYSQVYIHEIAINLARSHPPQRTMGAPAPFDSSAISNTGVRTSDNIHFCAGYLSLLCL